MAFRFVTHLLAWTAALVTAQVLAGLLGGGPLAGGQVAVWAGLALVFAAYPAGLAASQEALTDGHPPRRPARTRPRLRGGPAGRPAGGPCTLEAAPHPRLTPGPPRRPC